MHSPQSFVLVFVGGADEGAVRSNTKISAAQRGNFQSFVQACVAERKAAEGVPPTWYHPTSS